MGDHKLVVLSEHRGEDETQADEDGSHDEQNARAIRIEDLADDRREKKLADKFIIRACVKGRKGRTYRKEELN